MRRRLACLANCPKRMDNPLPKAFEFLNVFGHQYPQQLLAGRSQLDDRAAKVAFVRMTAYQTGAFRAIYKLNCAVVAKHHAIRKVAYRGRLARRCCCDYLQKLVLLSLDAVTLR